MMFIEALDYGVTIDSKETVNYFRNFPDRGSIGYFSFEDAEADRNPLGNVEKYLNIIEDFISAGLIGDHYVFSNGQVSEIISEYEGWDWTPETGIVPWKSEIDPEPEVCLNRKQRRSARRVQNARHKKSDRLHGKGVFSYEYKENRALKTQILPDNMRSKSAWSKACHEWGDPNGLKRRVPRTQSVNVHKDTKPVPEQEPWYVGVYGTLEVCKDVTVTMEWSVPEAVQGEPV